MTKKILAVTIFLVAAAAAAHADTFDYSYTFGDGKKVAGSFNGTLSGDLVTGLSNISAALDGVAFDGSGNLYAAHFVGGPVGWESGGAVASMSGTKNNFIFINSDAPTDWSYSAYFRSVPLSGATTDNSFAVRINVNADDTGGYNASRWTLTNSTVAAVPEPETYAMMLAGLGLMGAIARRKKKTPRA